MSVALSIIIIIPTCVSFLNHTEEEVSDLENNKPEVIVQENLHWIYLGWATHVVIFR